MPHILIVDDEPTQLTILSDILKSKGFIPISAQTGAAALEQSEHLRIDVALIDLRLEDMSGLDVLSSLKARSPETECIMLTGYASQTSAIESIQMGAYGYFQKPFDIEQVLISIQRAVEKREAAQALLESERFAHATVDALSAHIAILDETGTIIAVNRAWRAFAEENSAPGYAPSVFEGVNYLSVCDEAQGEYSEVAASMAAGIRAVISGGQSEFSLEYPCPSPTENRWFISRVTRFPGAGAVRVAVAHENITEVKLTEEALRKSEALLSEAQRVGKIGHWEWTAPGNEFICSDELFHILEIPPGDRRISKNIFVKMAHPEDHKKLKVMDAKMFAEHADMDYEYRILLPDNRLRWIHQQAKITYGDDGRPYRMMGVIQDVTERKLADEALHKSDAQYRLLANNISDVIWVLDVEAGCFTYVSPSVEQLRGYTVAEVLAEDMSKSMTPASLEYVQKNIPVRLAEAQQGIQVTHNDEVEQPRKDGTTVWTEITTHFVFNAETGHWEVYGVSRDLSQRKQAEEKLEEEKILLRTLIDNLPDRVYVMDTQGRKIISNIADWQASGGKTMEDVIGKTDLETYPPELAEDYWTHDKSVIDFGISIINREEPGLDSQGNPVWILSSKVPLRNRQGKILGLVGIGHDITERKKAEETLIASQQHYRQLIEGVPGIVYSFSDKRGGIYYSPRVEEILGYTPGYLYANPMIWHDSIHPDDLEQVNQSIQGFIQGRNLNIEYRVRNAHGEWRWLSDRSIGRDVRNSEVIIDGLAIDITERKRVEELIQNTERHFRALIEKAPDGIVLVGVSGLMTYASPSARRIFGYGLEDELSVNSVEGTHPDDVGRVLSALSSLIEDPTQVPTIQYRFRHKNGPWIWLESTFSNLLAEPSVQAIVINFHDISERKQAEELTRQHDEQLRILYEASQRLNRTLDLNEIYQTICDFMSSTAPNDGLVISAFDPETQLITCRAYWLDNRWLDVSPFPPILLEEEGRGTQSVAIRTGKSMLANDFQALVKTAQSSYVIDGDTNQISHEIPPEEEVTRSALIVPLKTGGAVSGVLQVLSYRLNAYSESQLQLLEALALHIASAEQNARLYIQVQTELNERKQAEKSLHASEEQYRTLLEQLPAIVYIDDVNVIGHTLYVSPQIETILGFTQQEWQDNSPGLWDKQIHEDDRVQTHEKYMRCSQHGEPLDVEYRIYTSDGRLLWFREQAMMLHDENGKPHLIQGLINDITERKQTEEALRHSTEWLGALAVLAKEVSATLDPHSIYTITHHHLRELVDCPTFAISIFDPSAETIHLTYVSTDGEEPDVSQIPAKKIDLKSESGRCRAIASQRPVIDHDMAAKIRASGRPLIGNDQIPNSAIYTPMVVDGQVIGLLELQSYLPHAYNVEDGKWLGMAANQIGLSIQNAHLFDETIQRVSELEVLNHVSIVLRSITDQDQMLAIMLEESLKALRSEHGTIDLWDRTTNSLRKTMARGWPADVNESVQGISEGIAGRVFTSGENYISREFISDPVTLAASRNQLPPGWGGICVPIRSAEHTLGTLLIATPVGRELTKNEIRLLNTLAEMAGASLHRMRLYEEAIHRMKDLQALRDVDQAITSNFDLRPTLDTVITHAIAQLGVDAADILLLRPHLQLLEYAAGQGFRSGFVKGASVRMGDSMAGRAALERRTMHIASLADAHANADFATLWKSESFASCYCVPLLAKGEVKGVLEVYQRNSLTPNPEWLNYLETLAGQAAIAIDSTQLFDNLQRANLELGVAYETTIESWSRALSLRDSETEGHTQRVTEMVTVLAQSFNYYGEALQHIRRGAVLHDIGKMGVPDHILLKPGPLTDEEWVQMRQHPQLAYDMLKPIAYLQDSLDIPHYHHEKWDGSGYPNKLAGDNIPLAARIFAIVDVYDALTNDRPYREAWSKEKTIEYIREQSGKHFDPQVVNAFLLEFGRKG